MGFGTEVWLIHNYEILSLLIECSFKQIYFQKEILNLFLGVTMSCFDVGCDIIARVTNAVLGHSQQDPIHVLPEMKLRGLVPNFHIHVSVSDLYCTYIPTIGLPIFDAAVSFPGIFVSNFGYSVFAVRGPNLQCILKWYGYRLFIATIIKYGW